MKNYKKGFVGIIVAIAIVAVVFLGYGAYKAFHEDKINEGGMNISAGDDFPSDYQPADHKNISVNTTATINKEWKTYRNEKYGFEFQYPQKFGDPVIANNTRELNCESENNNDVGLSPTISELSVQLACANYENSLLTSAIRLGGVEPQKIVIAGRQASMVEYTSATNYTNIEIFIPLGNGIFVHLFHTYKSGNSNYIELSSEELKSILSTFKFTNSVVSGTSDWKTYKNEKYGFEFKYRNNWSVQNKTDTQIILKQDSGQWKGDVITVDYISKSLINTETDAFDSNPNMITDTDSKFGSISYFFDKESNKWKKSPADQNDIDLTVVDAIPSFYVEGLPVFVGVSRWKTYIIPITYTQFVRFNITGGGSTEALDELIRTFKIKK